MTKFLSLLVLAAAIATVPAAWSFANTPPSAKAPARSEPRAIASAPRAPVLPSIDTGRADGCATAVRVAYAGYGEAARACAARQHPQAGAEQLQVR